MDVWMNVKDGWVDGWMDDVSKGGRGKVIQGFVSTGRILWDMDNHWEAVRRVLTSRDLRFTSVLSLQCMVVYSG